MLVDVDVFVSESAGEEVVVVLLLELELPPPAGDGLMIVVLLPAGEAAGEAPGATTFSVRCSHDARSAALARMQMYLVIVYLGWA